MVKISEHVTEAMSHEKLTQRQLRLLGRGATVAARNLADSSQYQIQFDCNRTIKVIGNRNPCQASLYIKRLDGKKVFKSMFGNNTSQVGLVKFIKDYGNEKGKGKKTA